jgi:hypothetical protein
MRFSESSFCRIEVSANLKFQAPNINEIPDINTQHAAQAPALRVTQIGLKF